MDKKPSGLPSPTGGKNKGLAIVGANPWSSSDSSDGIRILSGTGRDEARLGYITSPHQRDTNSGTPSWSSGKKLQVKRNMAIPESWKVHPRKDEVDPDGWTIEVRMRNNLKTKDKYYHHKDYNYTFRSRPEVQFFLDSGMVIVNKVPRILPKISADPSVPSSGHGRSCTTRTMTLNS
ncbi:hypothetical protein E2562_024042, partial [Oryza meyeriana var. granulata]